jgi:predicted MFS family arabinose efflux permease
VLLGSGFVIFAVPRLLASFGWRGAFFATAFVATAVLLVWRLAAVPVTPAPALPRNLREMLSTPALAAGSLQMASWLAIVGVWSRNSGRIWACCRYARAW